MSDSDIVNLAVSGGAMILIATLALRSGRTHPAEGRSTAAAISPIREATEASAQPMVVPGGRPRILTGEPAAPEQRKPAPRRALRLVAGITTLAVAGAVGLIVVVRALIEMFQQIGG